MLADNLLTAKAWQIRANFKYLFQIKADVEFHYKLWKDNAISQSTAAINGVIKTFDNRLPGIFNAITIH